jgi:hypothetical protein
MQPDRPEGEDPAPQAATAADSTGQRTTPVLTVGEVAVGTAAILVGLVAWAALALANAGAYRLWPALALAGGGMVLVAAAVALSRPRPRVVVARRELAVLVVLAAVTAWLTFPGFPYGIGDKDPGVYISHAVSIARTGSTDIDDPVQERLPNGFRSASPGARLPGVWYHRTADGQVRTHVQFYHLWPALLAVAWSVGDLAGHPLGTMVNLDPLLGVLAVLAFTLLVKRAFGLLTGGIAGLLLGVDLIQVWQSRYQTAEVLTELLIVVALFGVVVALKTRWRPAAGIGGLALGLAFLARADTLLLLLLAVAVGAALIALGRFDARAAWFAGGLAVTLPHSLYQAYDLAASYTAVNGVPGLPLVATLTAAVLVAALAVRRFARPLSDRVRGLLTDERAQFRIGLVLTGLAAVAMLVGFLRPWLFGPVVGEYNGRILRTYDEQTMRRLSWFFTLPGMALLGGGFAAVALRRWRAAAWATILPMLVSLPIYAVSASNSARLLWWNRRFVPVVAPGIVTLIAVALVVGLLATGRLRLPARLLAAAATVALVAAFAVRTVPLRPHQEFAGSFAIIERLAALPGGHQGVYLFGPTTGARLDVASSWGTPLWLQHGEVVGLLLVGSDGKLVADNVQHVRAWQRAFPGDPVYVVLQGGDLPPQLAPLGLTLRDRVDTRLPMWTESDIELPSAPRTAAVDLSIWQVGSGA